MSNSANTQPLALLYVRVSTNRQAANGHSLESQPAILEAAASAAGYRVEIVSETGSGRKASRPALTEALRRLKAGEAQALYAVDIDRLARSTQHFLAIAEAGRKQGWRLVVTSADMDSTTANGELFLTMAAAFAQYESRMISARVSRQHENRRARGIVWGVHEGSRCELPAETVALITGLRGEGVSLRGIVAELVSRNIPTARGGVWQPATVRAVLNSPLVRDAA
jgi:DNA invertase Pin-like site-specific DNA recombinase